MIFVEGHTFLVDFCRSADVFSRFSLLIDRISQSTRSSGGPLVVQTVHLWATAFVVVGTLVARCRCFLFVLFVAAVVRIAVRVSAVILLALAELHEIHSRSACLAEARGGALPHEGSVELDLADHVVDLGVASIVAIVVLGPRTVEGFERHLSDALEVDDARHFGFSRPRFGLVAIASVLLEVDVDGDDVVALSLHRIMHIACIHPLLFVVDGLESLQVELDGILARRRRGTRTELGFRLLLLLRLGTKVHRTEDGAGVGDAGRAADGCRHAWLMLGVEAGRGLLWFSR